jgi:hypothetical protein
MALFSWRFHPGGTGAPELVPVAYPLLNQVRDSGILTYDNVLTGQTRKEMPE